MKIIEIDIPEYTIHQEPDIQAIGAKLDKVLQQNFSGKKVLIRGLASSEHPDKPPEDLLQIIRSTGTDRYNPKRAGDRYENIEGKQIDIFAFPATVSAQTKIFDQLVYGFYHSSIGFHGRPMRIDIITIYDATKLNVVKHQYREDGKIKSDGFIFKNPEDKPGAVFGIIRVL